MNHYQDKTKLQLIEEIESLKKRIEELEQSEFKYKQAEQTIKSSEIKLRDIIEHSSNLFYSHTPDHLITYVSPQTREFLDCEPEEAKMRWTEFVTENPGNETGFILTNRAIKTGKIQPSYELELAGKKGRKLWVEVNEAPVIEGGQTVAIVGALTDITDRKHAEEALIESKQMLSDVLNTIPVRVFWKDLDGVYLGCNQLFARDAGRGNPEEVIGDNDYNLGWAEQAELYRSDDRFVIESGQPKINYEEPQTTPEGKTIWLRTSKIPLLNSTGNIYGVLGTYEDITERKQAEEALLRSEAMFKGIFSQAPVGIELYDSEGSLINANQESLNIFGVESVDDVKGFKLFEDPTISEEVKIQLRNGLPIDYESEFDFEFIKKLKLYKTTKSGKCFLQIQIMPYNISDKGDRGFVVHVQNITERKQAEQALRDSEYLLRESQKVANLGYYELDILTGNWTSSKILDNIFGIEDNFVKKVEGWSDILHPESQEEMLTYFNESVLKHHQKFDKEYRIIRISNGEERWVHGSGELELDGDGNPVKMIGTIQDISEQKRTEEALQKSKERYRSLYQNTPAMLHSIDQEGRLTNVSKYWLKIMGYSLDEVLGKHSTDFMTGESSRYAKEVILPKFYETGSCRDVPYQYVKKNGEVMDALLSAITENDENGELIHSLSVIIDVTDRKQAEASLRQSEARLRQVIDLVPHYIFAKDHKGRFILANSASAESMGTTHEEIIGKTELEIAPVKKEAQVFTKDDAEVISSGKPKFIPEVRFTDVEGKSHILQTIKIPFTASGTQNPSVLGVSVDITERKKAEEAHRESEERFSRLSGAAFEGIVISDSGKIIDVNDQLAKILGYKPEEIIGKTAMEFVAPESCELVMNNIKAGTEGSYEHFALKKDGSIFPVEVQAKTLPYEGRSFRVTAIRDITERKKAEEALKEAYDIINKSPAIPFLWENEEGWPVEYVSENVVDLFEYTAEEFMSGKVNYSKLIYPEDLERVGNEVTRYSSEEGTDRFSHEPYRIITKSGKVKWIEDKTYFRRDENNNITHYQGIVEDITERKLSEDALKEQLYLNQQILETTLDGYILADSDGNIIDVNPAYCDMIGYNWEELLDMNIREVEVKIPPEKVDRRIQKMIRMGGDHFETKHKHKEGYILELDTSTCITYLDEAPRVAAFMRDITERKKAEEEIRKLSHSVEQSPAIVVITNTSGNIEYVNPKFEEVTGYTANEVIGINPNILKSGKTTTEEYEILWKTIKSGGEWHGEFQNRKKNGELYWESASISAIKDTKGQNTHYIAIKEDITGRKAMDKRLRESHNRLRSFAERLQMIREEERATIAREIHDDLGQSLTALKMDISWVKNNPEMGEEAKTAKFDMMLDLTNSTIQTVKRIATELRPGILDDLGLVPAIEWQATEFQNRFKIQCNVTINKSDVIIKDEISIAVFRIFQETLTNVARHSGATKVDVNLNFYDDNKLIMEITDNGVGIDEEKINSSKSLGLFGMRERVNILKGRVEIIGDHGKGTKVRVSIPVSKEDVGNNK